MDFSFHSEVNLLRQSARKFTEEVKPLIREYEEKEKFPLVILPKMRDLGFLGGVIPTKYGGSGLDFMSFTVIVEELARVWQVLGSAASIASGPAGSALMKWGTEEQKNRFLEPVAKGEKIAGLGLTEPHSGTDVAAMETVGRKEGEYYVINGAKTWIDWAPIGDLFLTFAQLDKSKGKDGIIAFIVERGTPGFSTTAFHGKLGLRSLEVGELLFDECRIPVQNVLGGEGEGYKIAMHDLEDTRLSVAARLIGGIRACLEECVEYANTRVIFGKSLGKLQLIQGKIANMKMAYETAKWLTYHAAWVKDQGKSGGNEVNMAKLYAQKKFLEVAADAVQIFGAYGVSSEYNVERYFRDAKVSQITGGTNEILTLLVASHALGNR